MSPHKGDVRERLQNPRGGLEAVQLYWIPSVGVPFLFAFCLVRSFFA